MTVGDIVDFIEYGTDNHFATGKLTKVIEKPLGELTDEDTLVKLIWFELIK